MRILGPVVTPLTPLVAFCDPKMTLRAVQNSIYVVLREGAPAAQIFVDARDDVAPGVDQTARRPPPAPQKKIDGKESGNRRLLPETVMLATCGHASKPIFFFNPGDVGAPLSIARRP